MEQSSVKFINYIWSTFQWRAIYRCHSCNRWTICKGSQGILSFFIGLYFLSSVLFFFIIIPYFGKSLMCTLSHNFRLQKCLWNEENIPWNVKSVSLASLNDCALRENFRNIFDSPLDLSRYVRGVFFHCDKTAGNLGILLVRYLYNVCLKISLYLEMLTVNDQGRVKKRGCC